MIYAQKLKLWISIEKCEFLKRHGIFDPKLKKVLRSQLCKIRLFVGF